MNTLIQDYKTALEKFNYSCWIEDGLIKIFVHVKGSIDGLFPDANDIANINWCIENGYTLVNTVDCRNRTEDRYDTIIYWYHKPAKPVNETDAAFLKEYEEAIFYKYDVLRKYGIYEPVYEAI